MLPKCFAMSDDDEESDCSIPRDDKSNAAQDLNDGPISVNEYYSTTVELPNLTWHGYSNCPKALTVMNTGETVSVTGTWGRGRPYVGGGPLNGSYLFSQIHFHWPSEHIMNEKRYPLEMHAVHYKAAYLTQERAMKEPDGTVVLVYFFEVTCDDCTPMSKITNSLASIKQKNSKFQICDASLEEFVKPFHTNYFIYWGDADIDDAIYSLQWIISCSRLPVSQRELCTLQEFFSNGTGECPKKSRDSKPVTGMFLVGETVNRTCSEGYRAEVRFSDRDRSMQGYDSCSGQYEAERSRSCCFLAKYRKGSGCFRIKDKTPGERDGCNANKSVEQIYARKSSQCSRETSPCSQRHEHNQKKTCTDKNCQTSECKPCTIDTQTSSGSFGMSCRRGKSANAKSRSSCRTSDSDPCSGFTTDRTGDSCSRSHSCRCQNSRSRGCSVSRCGRGSIRSSDACNRNQKNCKKHSKDRNASKKKRHTSENDSSSDDDYPKCKVKCKVLQSVSGSACESPYKLVKCKVECSSDEEDEDSRRSRKKSKSKRDDDRSSTRSKSESGARKGSKKRRQTSEEDAQTTSDGDKQARKRGSKPVRKSNADTSGDEASVKKKPKGKSSKTKSENEEKEVESKSSKSKQRKGGKSSGDEGKGKGKRSEKSDDEGTLSESKEMGQHKPIILAPATVDENTYILKSVGTMTLGLQPGGHMEGMGAVEEDSPGTESAISRSQVWSKERRTSSMESDRVAMMDKIMGVPENEETEDLLSATKIEDCDESKTADTSSSSAPQKEPSLSTILARISKDPSLGNVLNQISAEPASSTDAEKVGKEPSLSSILAKISKDSSLACILSQGSVPVQSPDGSPADKKPSLAAVWAKISKGSVSGECGNKTGKDSLSNVLSKLSREFSDKQTRENGQPHNEQSSPSILAKVSEKPGTSDQPTKEQTLTIILASVPKKPTYPTEMSNNSLEPPFPSDTGMSKEPIPVEHSQRDFPNAFPKSSPAIVDDQSTVKSGIKTPERDSQQRKQPFRARKNQSLASVLHRVSREPSLAADLVNILREPTSMASSDKNSIEKSLVSVLDRVARDPSLAADLVNLLRESALDTDLPQSSRERSLANVLNAISREPSLATDLSRSARDSTLAGVIAKVSKEPTPIGSEKPTPESCQDQSVAHIAAAVAREPSLATDLANILRDDPSGSSLHTTENVSSKTGCDDHKKTVKEPSLVSILDKISKDPSLVLHLADVLRYRTTTEEVARTMDSPSAASTSTKEPIPVRVKATFERSGTAIPRLPADLAKSLRDESLANILLRAKKEPSFATDLANILSQTSAYRNLENVSKATSMTSDLVKSARDRSLANIVARVSREPSLARDLANVLTKPLAPSSTRNFTSEQFLVPDFEKYPRKGISGTVHLSREPCCSTSEAKKDDLFSAILQRVSNEPSLAADLCNVLGQAHPSAPPAHISRTASEVSDAARPRKEQSLANIVSRVSREPSLARDLAKILTQSTSTVDRQRSAKVQSLANILNAVSKKPSLANDIVNCAKAQSYASVPGKVAKDPPPRHCAEGRAPDLSPDLELSSSSIPKREPSSSRVATVAFSSLPPKPILLDPLSGQEGHSATMSIDACSESNKPEKQSSLASILSKISKEPSLAVELMKISKEQVAKDVATILKQPESHGKEGVVEGKSSAERTHVNFESGATKIDTERPEVEKLHRQEDLNESIKSRRSSETRRSGDDETSAEKKAVEESRASQVQSRTDTIATTDSQPFEEYYVRVEHDNSVLQEYTGKLDPSDMLPGNAVKLRLIPKTSVPVDDLDLEMEDCIIRFDSKEKTEQLYVEAHFLVGRKAPAMDGEEEAAAGGSRPLVASPGKTLEITRGLEESKEAEDGSLVDAKKESPLYFISEGIETDPETGKKVLKGRFVREAEWQVSQRLNKPKLS